MQRLKALRLVASAALLISILACGGADDEEGASATATARSEEEPAPESTGDPLAYVFGGYHCDLRASQMAEGTCEEPSETNLVLGVEFAQTACTNRGGAWSEGECPTEERLGTCATAGGGRTHYYSGANTPEEADSACRTRSLGTWTPVE